MYVDLEDLRCFFVIHSGAKQQLSNLKFMAAAWRRLHWIYVECNSHLLDM